jgi:hypothetical protein
LTTQIDELILKTAGEEEVRKLQRALEAHDDALRKSINTHGAHAAASQAAAQQVIGTATQLKAAEAALRSAAVGSGALNQSLTTLTFTLDDAQQFGQSTAAGFRAISNQIPSLVAATQSLTQVGLKGAITALAGPAGIAFALTGAGIAAGQLAAHWEQIEQIMGLGIPAPARTGLEALTESVKKLGDELEKLQSQKRLDLSEVIKIGKLKEQLEDAKKKLEDAKALKDILDAPAQEQQDTASGFRKAVAESGGQAALDELAGTFTPDDNGKLVSPLGGIGTPEEIAKELFLQAAKGDVFARNEVRSRVGENSEFGKRIDEFSPERKAEDKRTADEDADILSFDKQQQDRAIEAAKKKKEEEKKAAETFAGNLQESVSRDALAGKAPDRAGVKKRLQEFQGLSPEEAEKFADQVGKDLKLDLGKAVLKRAGDKGITTDEARTQLGEESAEKAKAEGEKKAKKALEDAEDRDPGLKILAKAAASGGFAEGGALAAAARAERLLRQRGGLSEADAKAVGKDLAADEQRKATDRFLAPEKLRNSTTLDAASLAGAVQAGVGGQDDAAKNSGYTVEELRTLNKKFDRLIQMQPGPRPRTTTRRA